jgi:hypothetical protein
MSSRGTVIISNFPRCSLATGNLAGLPAHMRSAALEGP